MLQCATFGSDDHRACRPGRAGARTRAAAVHGSTRCSSTSAATRQSRAAERRLHVERLDVGVHHLVAVRGGGRRVRLVALEHRRPRPGRAPSAAWRGRRRAQPRSSTRRAVDRDLARRSRAAGSGTASSRLIRHGAPTDTVHGRSSSSAAAAARGSTASDPKPLIEIGGRPIVWHVVSIYAAQGSPRFLLLTGYQGEWWREIGAARAVAGRRRASSASTPGSTRRPAGGCTRCASGCDAPFCLTYADGVADIDLAALRAATRRGRARDDDGRAARAAVRRRRCSTATARVTRVPREAERRPVGQRRLLRARAGRAGVLAADSVLEREPLERLAADGALARLPPHGLLALPGHGEGRGAARRACAGPLGWAH